MDADEVGRFRARFGLSWRDVNHAVSAAAVRWPLRHRGPRWFSCWRCWADVAMSAYVLAASVVLFGSVAGLWGWPCPAK